MFRILKAMFFGDKGIVESAVDGADTFVQTPDERASHINDTLKNYTPFKIAQRFFMLSVVPPYMFCWVIAFISGFKWEVSNAQLELLNGDIQYVVMIVATFYFGGGAAEGVVEMFKKKISK